MKQQPTLVYFSSLSRNTQRFVDAVGLPAKRIPISPKDEFLTMSEPFILICPTYAGDDGSGAVPKQVIKFLNNQDNRNYLRGVIASGNRNFGKYYAYAGKVISHKCNVPFLYSFELMGTPEDIKNVRQGVTDLWQTMLPSKQPLKQTA